MLISFYNSIHKFLRVYLVECIVMLLFLVSYAKLSLYKHYQFDSTYLDLGMFNRAIWQYGHGIMANYRYPEEDAEGKQICINYLADHFSPITIIYSPLQYIFGSYTLLIIQIAVVLYGGWGIVHYVKCFVASPVIRRFSWLFLIMFLSFWGVYSVINFDFHNNVVASMLLVWLCIYYKQKKYLHFGVIYTLMLISKENISFWLGFVILGLVFQDLRAKLDFNKLKLLSANWAKRGIYIRIYRQHIRKYIRFELPLIIFSFCYFYLVSFYLMSELAGFKTQAGRLTHLGDSIFSIVLNILQHPKILIQHLIDAPKDKFQLFIDFWRYFLFNGGIVVFLSFSGFIMVLPIFVQKFLLLEPNLWSPYFQYSVKLAPLVVIGWIELLAGKSWLSKGVYWIIKGFYKRAQNLIPIVLVILLFIITISTYIISYNKYLPLRFRKPFYSNIPAINQALKSIPDTASISASDILTPHLGFRDKIYVFPTKATKAEYVVVFTRIHNPLPWRDPKKYYARVAELRQDTSLSIAYEANDLLILKRK